MKLLTKGWRRKRSHVETKKMLQEKKPQEDNVSIDSEKRVFSREGFLQRPVLLNCYRG